MEIVKQLKQKGVRITFTQIMLTGMLALQTQAFFFSQYARPLQYNGSVSGQVEYLTPVGCSTGQGGTISPNC